MKTLFSPSTLALVLALPTGCIYDYPATDGGDDEIGETGAASDPPSEGYCQDVPAPWLPFPAGTSMGITQKPGCGDHQGAIYFAYDFNVASTFETDNDLIAVASSSGKVVHVVDWVTDGCIGCTSAAYNGGWGNCVIVQLDDSCIYERYCHLDKGPNNIFVHEGDPVCPGTPLGLIGSTGHSDGPHLHWQREDENQKSIPVDGFAEVDIPNGCDPCVIEDNAAGCFASQNQEQCVSASPCVGLQDGDYCGSNDQLQEYPGDSADLVTCGAGEVVNVMPCEYGCEEMLEGTHDECHDPSADCGNGVIDVGEQCDGDLGDATCASEGFDDGVLACNQHCTFDTDQCCNQQAGILAALYPDFTQDASGCALDNGLQLKASAEPISESVIRFHVRKTDDSPWAQPAVLTLYVGEGPTCGDPGNVAKNAAPVVVGQVTQTIDLVVDPYDAVWPSGQVKEFWIGKSETEYAAARSTGAVPILRECLQP